MKMNEETIEIANPLAPLKKFTLSDSNFVNILIDDGDLYIEENGQKKPNLINVYE